MTIKIIKFKDNTYSWQTNWNTSSPSNEAEFVAYGKWMYQIDVNETKFVLKMLKSQDHDIAIYNPTLKTFVKTQKLGMA